MTGHGPRTLVNCLSAGSGGSLSYVRNLLPRLVAEAERQGMPSRFCFLHGQQQRALFSEIDEADRIEVEESACSSPLRRYLWESRHLPQVVASHSVGQVFLPSQFGAIVDGIENVLMIRNMEPFFAGRYRYALAKGVRNRVLAPLSRRALIRADRVIAVSAFSRQYCLEGIGIPERKLSLVYHGRDASFSPERGPHDAGVLARYGLADDYVFSCGSMLPYRRFEDIIAAYGRLLSERPSLPPLILAGGREDSRYARLIETAAAKTALPQAIRHIGRLAYEDMQVLYRNSLVFVMSSEIEACPNVGIEAMSSGCAILSSDNPPLPEIFQDAALYYPARNAAGLAARLAELLDSPQMRQQLSELALERAAFFSWQRCAEETLAVLSASTCQAERRSGIPASLGA